MPLAGIDRRRAIDVAAELLPVSPSISFPPVKMASGRLINRWRGGIGAFRFDSPFRNRNGRPIACLTVLALLVTLSACSTGDADDSIESATKAAEESTNVVADIEATQVVREFFTSTEEPTAVPTVMPSLANLRLTESLRNQDEPADNLQRVRRGSRIYAAAQIANLFPGQRVVALWKDSGQVIATSEVRIENERELVWIPLQWDVPSSLPAGTYSVVIQVIGPGVDADGEEIELIVDVGSLVFEMD